MRVCRHTLTIGAFLLPIFFLVSVNPVLGSAQLFQPVQVTTHPGEDFASTLSADGSLMVFVSDRSGNLDLWLKHRGQGVQTPDKQLTFHSAEDNSPKLSPKGDRLVFISHRSDPKGDIYIMDLNRDGPVDPEKSGGARLTDGDFPEEDPEWSPDERFIYFTSIDRKTRTPGIYKVDVKTQARTLVIENAVNPAISPDGKYLAFVTSGLQRDLWVLDLGGGVPIQITSGPAIEISPSWSKRSDQIFFTRFQDDTDFDGELSINDNSSIWKVGFNSGKSGIFRQLTDSSTYDLFPQTSANEKLILTSSRQASIDIWEMPDEGLLPRVEGYGNSLQVVADLCSGEEGDSYTCLMAYANIVHEFDGKDSLARIRYRFARGFKKRGHLKKAARLFEEVIKKHPAEMEYRGLSEIDLLLLELESSKRMGPTVYEEKVRTGIGELEKIVSRYKESRSIGARAYFEMGNLYFELEDQARALNLYDKVTDGYPGQRYLSAGAAFSRSQIYALVGDREKLVLAYVQVVKDYYDVEFWSDKAVQEILNIYEKQPTLEKKVSSLQSLTVRYKDVPRLAGDIQNRIGELFYQANENLLAKEAYQKTISRFSKAESQTFSAKVALANIYSEEENFEKSLRLYKEISLDAELPEDFTTKAKAGLIRKTLEKGAWELKVGEVKLALKTFRRLMDFSPETVGAHRGYLQASAALKKSEKAVGFYKDRLKNGRKDSAVDHYALGLAYTYLSPPDLDQAQKSISKALAIDSGQVFFHQTLGFVFEQKERLVKGEDYLERAVAEYQMALALNDGSSDPENEANLLLNLGNGHYLLNNFNSAAQYYKERKSSGIGFFNPARQSIFHQRFGESAFKSGFHEEAIIQYKKALKIVAGKESLNRMAELNDRIALVYQDRGDFAKAVEYFSKTLELNQQAGNEVSLSRSLRNIANNLFSLNQEKKEPDTKAMNLALNNYFTAIESLKKYGVVQRAKKKKKDALFGVAVQTGLGEGASQAATGFDRVGEQKLIFHYIGKIYSDFGEYDKAVEYFKKKLALIPKDLDVEKNIPILLEKALLQNQIGNFLFQNGEYDASLVFFKKSYTLSQKLNNKRGMAVNAVNIGRVVYTKCQYMPLAGLKGEIENAVRLLGEASTEMGEMENYSSPEYILIVGNYLGIFHHYLGYYFSPDPAGNGKKKPEEKLRSIVEAATSGLKRDFDHVRQSREYFSQGLARIAKSKESFPEIESALRQNLELAVRLAGGTANEAKDQAQTGDAPEKNIPPHRLWQYKYIESLVASLPERLPLLLDAEKLL
ncbi:hypothetical protein MNBD_NITROSPINAE05-713, partial [hydrothermal vent metagenome]